MQCEEDNEQQHESNAHADAGEHQRVRVTEENAHERTSAIDRGDTSHYDETDDL